MAGNREAAAYWHDQTLSRRPDASVEKFFAAFPFTNPDIREGLNKALLSLGLPEK